MAGLLVPVHPHDGRRGRAAVFSLRARHDAPRVACILDNVHLVQVGGRCQCPPHPAAAQLQGSVAAEEVAAGSASVVAGSTSVVAGSGSVVAGSGSGCHAAAAAPAAAARSVPAAPLPPAARAAAALQAAAAPPPPRPYAAAVKPAAQPAVTPAAASMEADGEEPYDRLLILAQVALEDTKRRGR